MLDPGTAALIAGGADFFGNLLQGPSESEKAAMMQARLAERAYDDSRADQRRALGFGEAQLQAKRAMMQALMQRMAGMKTARPDLAGVFASQRNPYGGGVAGSGVVSTREPFQFTDEAMGANVKLPGRGPAAPRFGPTGNSLMDKHLAKLEDRLREKYGAAAGY